MWIKKLPVRTTGKEKEGNECPLFPIYTNVKYPNATNIAKPAPINIPKNEQKCFTDVSFLNRSVSPVITEATPIRKIKIIGIGIIVPTIAITNETIPKVEFLRLSFPMFLPTMLNVLKSLHYHVLADHNQRFQKLLFRHLSRQHSHKNRRQYHHLV